MRIYLMIGIALMALGCNNPKQAKKDTPANHVTLTTGAANVATLKDTLVIYADVCRGCAYEQSTHFGIEDTAGLITLEKIVTTDNNPSDVNGGSVEKDIYLVPQRTGKTTLRVYKFRNDHPDAADSSAFDVYNLEIKN